MGILESRNVRIAFVVFGDLDERSGGFLYDSKLERSLSAAGDSVRLVSQRDGGTLRRLSGNRGLAGRIAEAEADLVLIDELNHAAAFLAAPRIAERLGIPVVAVVHHLRCEEELGPAERIAVRAMERRFLRGADAVVCNSEATAASARALAALRDTPLLVAHPGKDRYPAAAAAAPRPDAAPLRILFIGNVIPRKNLETLIRAASSLPAGRWTLDVCGDLRTDPIHAARMADLAARMAGSEAIRFRGRTDDARTGELLAAADVLAVPSDVEGFGIVYLEAMHAGAVPIASERGGASDLVREGIDGFLVRPRDVAGLADRLRTLLEHPDRLAAMRRAARERTAGFPTWEESMGRVVRFLHRIAEQVER